MCLVEGAVGKKNPKSENVFFFLKIHHTLVLLQYLVLKISLLALVRHDFSPEH